MLKGKKHTPEDLVLIAWRRKWLIGVPLVAATAATLVMSRGIPDRYRSDTLILLVPQRVPESYVKATVTARIADRLHSISQQTLSRTRLEGIVLELNLYAEQRRTQMMEDVIEQMRADIDVRVVKGEAFRIAYASQDPATAMRVTERLATLFISENMKEREVLAEGTNQFLDAQLREARQRLVEQERRIEQFRVSHSGELPSQLASNLQVIQSMQARTQSVTDSLNRDRDRRLFLERMAAESEGAPETAVSIATPTNGAPPQPLLGTPTELEAARGTLASLSLRLKPDHPDVVRMARTIADLEERRSRDKQAPQAAPPQVAPRAVPAPGRNVRLRELRAEIESLDRQIALREAEEVRLRGMVEDYQKRVDVVPVREAQLAELSRDHDTTQKVYQELLTKRHESKIAADLERRQIGEQFKVLDPARLPERPFSPNRLLIQSAGTMAGLLVGLALAVLFEFRDRTLYTEADVSYVVSLPLLAVLPQMKTTQALRLRRRRLAAASAGVLVVLTGTTGLILWWFPELVNRWVP